VAIGEGDEVIVTLEYTHRDHVLTGPFKAIKKMCPTFAAESSLRPRRRIENGYVLLTAE